MKTKGFLILGSVLVSSIATDALGQFGQPVRASVILGCTVKDSQDKDVGTVRDLAIDLNNGRVVEAILARGGFLGLDSKLVAVPPEFFTVADNGKRVSLILAADKLNGAPAVDLSKWQDCMAQARVEEVYQYYGSTPYFLVPAYQAQNPRNPLLLRLGEALRASRLIGMETLNHQDEKLGKLENLAVDLPQGRVVEAVIATGSFLGLRGELSAVPPEALHPDASRGVLTLETTKEALGNAPHFPSRNWPRIDRDQATAVYQSYHVLPYFLPGMTGSAQNAPEVKGAIQSPLEQGTNPGDLQITAQIQKEILDTDGLSVDARAVKVTTLNGLVTLRGTVADSSEKRRLGDIAARVVPASKVDNQLQIKETASTAN
jgi:sporulation protein YlmC with PRC-barrel domain